jgi:fructokinase
MERIQPQRPIMFGEVLFDLFPDGSVVLGGAPFNVAWHLQAFGLNPLLISRVGSDALGRQIRAAMNEWGMDCSGLQLDSAHKTGIVDITFTAGEPNFDIANNRAFDFIDRYALPPLRTDGPLYHGTLALRNPVSRDTLVELRQHSEGCSFVDVNLRPPWWNRELVLEQLAGACTIKLNHAELEKLMPGPTGLEARATTLLRDMGAQQLVVTSGKEGARLYGADGSMCQVAPEPASSLVDTVGAGDAFSAILLLGQISGWDLEDSMERAQGFASAIVGMRGAIVRNMGFYRQFIDRWGVDTQPGLSVQPGKDQLPDVAEAK